MPILNERQLELAATECCQSAAGRLNNSLRLCRIARDFGVMYFGIPTFKIARLILCIVLVVHILACGFYRVKVESAPASDVTDFFQAIDVDPQASSVPRVAQ